MEHHEISFGVMMRGEANERDDLWLELSKYLDKIRAYSEKPENRARRLSLAITNLEQGLLWLGEHIVKDSPPESNAS